jgi:hypothetical protein
MGAVGVTQGVGLECKPHYHKKKKKKNFVVRNHKYLYRIESEKKKRQ